MAATVKPIQSLEVEAFSLRMDSNKLLVFLQGKSEKDLRTIQNHFDKKSSDFKTQFIVAGIISSLFVIVGAAIVIAPAVTWHAIGPTMPGFLVVSKIIITVSVVLGVGVGAVSYVIWRNFGASELYEYKRIENSKKVVLTHALTVLNSQINV